MKFECPICYETFDGKDRVPYEIKTCGHSFCAECIKKSVTSNEPTSYSQRTYSFKCPLCKIVFHQNDDILARFDSYFPRNYLIIQSIEYQKTMNLKVEICSFHSKPIYLVCLNEKCKHPTKCCLQCVRQVHSECDDEYLLPINEIGNKVSILNYKDENAHYEKALSTVIKDGKTNFNAVLDSMFDRYKVSLSDFGVPHQLLDPFYEKFDPSVIRLLNKAPEKMTVGPYNINEFESRAADADTVKEILDRFKEDLSLKCDDFLVNSFKSLAEARTKKNEISEIRKELNCEQDQKDANSV